MQKSEQVTSLCVPGDSEGDEEETTQDEVSSHTSEEDGGVVKVEKELENAEQPVGGKKVAEREASDKWLLGTLPLLLCPDASPPEATLTSARFSDAASLLLQHQVPYPQAHSSHHTQPSFSTRPHITLPTHSSYSQSSPLLSGRMSIFVKLLADFLRCTLEYACKFQSQC